jgi:DNA-binding response OmpR family regulator
MRLLLVEDDENIVETIKLCFKIYEPSLKLSVTGKGQDGLIEIMENNYDGMILDLGLPDIDGTDVIAQLRSFSQKPVIVVSARGDSASIAKSLALGANDYVVKPFNAWELLERFNKLFKIN